jgi:hypothetical protein
MQWLTWLLSNYDALISAIVGILSALIALALLIPGDQPEATLRKWVDFLAKFSRK